MTYAEQMKTEGRLEGIKEGKLEGIKEGKLEGIKEGKLEGIKEGKLEGKLEGIEEMAVNLLKLNLKANIIKQSTGLSLERITQLKHKNGL